MPQGEALSGALRWAEMITKNSPMSIRASKQTIQKGLAVSLEQAIEEQREYPAVKAMVASQDYIEARRRSRRSGRRNGWGSRNRLFPRHGRACPGHPRLDAHDEERGCPGQARA
ncbi:hypothetical protein ACVI53_001913 [Bradyrhizobium barranii subsp. barranii]